MGPLAGVRVVEFNAIGPVPLCAMMLADMGADIVRLARPPASRGNDGLGEEILHRGRTSVVVDLKNGDDRDAALSMIERADILLEGFRPGVMERLGLGPDICLGRAPALVYGRMTGWGQTGELSDRAGHDINYISIAGALGAMGEPDRPPPPPLNLVGDYGGGSMLLAMGVLAALTEARRTGKGQVVDAAMTDGTAVLLSMFHAFRHIGAWDLDRGSNLLDGGAPFYRCYECSDGKYVAVGALEPQFYAQLLSGLELQPDEFPQGDRARWKEMGEAFAKCFATKTRDEWEGIFAGTDACVSPVLDMAEAVDHPHNKYRDTFVEHGGIVQPAPAPRFSRTPGTIRELKAAPAQDVIERWSTDT